MTKVALFFKKWKNYSRHKKLNEDWSLATSLKDFSENGEEEIDENSTEFDIFPVKYLGSTSIDLPRSEEATAEAVKKIIASAKANNKKLHRLNLSVCPRGIESFDAITGETILNVSIYKISYCSADAAHNNVFAFVAGTKDNLGNDESDILACHAFICQKRKVAHKLTLTVAKCFERAFKQWQESVQRKKHRSKIDQIEKSENRSMANIEVYSEPMDACASTSADESNGNSAENLRNLLIDFGSEIDSVVDRRNLLQNTWVSFDDEPQICENGNLMPGRVFENNMWEKNLICSL